MTETKYFILYLSSLAFSLLHTNAAAMGGTPTMRRENCDIKEIAGQLSHEFNQVMERFDKCDCPFSRYGSSSASFPYSGGAGVPGQMGREGSPYGSSSSVNNPYAGSSSASSPVKNLYSDLGGGGYSAPQSQYSSPRGSFKEFDPYSAPSSSYESQGIGPVVGRKPSFDQYGGNPLPSRYHQRKSECPCHSRGRYESMSSIPSSRCGGSGGGRGDRDLGDRTDRPLGRYDSPSGSYDSRSPYSSSAYGPSTPGSSPPSYCPKECLTVSEGGTRPDHHTHHHHTVPELDPFGQVRNVPITGTPSTSSYGQGYPSSSSYSPTATGSSYPYSMGSGYPTSGYPQSDYSSAMTTPPGPLTAKTIAKQAVTSLTKGANFAVNDALTSLTGGAKQPSSLLNMAKSFKF